jgi:poly-gamma-glutamate synthesis protein (capsule biosynthesis protein)
MRTKKKQVRISIVGDIMCHSSQLNSYYDPKTKEYHPEKSFELISDKFKDSDLVLGNLETTIVANSSDYSGYPRFGSPISLAVALKKTGFNILSTANNHSADKGSSGIDLTISTVSELGMIPIGTYQSDSDYENRRHLIFTQNGMKIAIYNYTYSTNGIKVPNGKIVRLIDEKTIRKDIQYAKAQSVDFILIWYHFGTEYQISPDTSQIKWVALAIQEGADVVIGGHPHVVQRQEKKQEQFIAYSLGNFLSAQNRSFTDGGMILKFNLLIDGSGNKQVTNIFSEPVWVDPHGYKIIPIEDALNGELKVPLTPYQQKKMKNYQREYLKVMSENKL